MQKKILNELNNNGLKLYSLKKNYKELQLIKKNILNKYRLEIDWLEIENIGTKYIVRYEPRIKNDIINEEKPRHIISLKNAIIYDLDISNGQIIRGKNSYVKKGDIIVSGYIYLNDTIKNSISSKGKVYGEVWYEVTVTYPFKYHEEKLTGKSKNVYVINLLNKNIELFNLKHYKNKKVKSNILLKNNILPFSLEKQYQKELVVIDNNYTYEEAINKAVETATLKIEKNLNEKEFILNKKVINSYKELDKVVVKIFYSVIEDITDYQEIPNYEEINNDPIN